MKIRIIISLAVLSILMLSCRDRVVYYPIPLKSQVLFVIQASNGSYDYNGAILVGDIFQDLQAELANAGLSLKDVDRMKLEGVAYTIYDVTDNNTVINGVVDVSLNSLAPASFLNILTLSNVNLGQIAGIPQINLLNSAGVGLLNQAMQSLLSSQGLSGFIGVNSKGALVSGNQSVAFKMRVEFTITTVVKKNQKIFDPLG